MPAVARRALLRGLELSKEALDTSSVCGEGNLTWSEPSVQLHNFGGPELSLCPSCRAVRSWRNPGLLTSIPEPKDMYFWRSCVPQLALTTSVPSPYDVLLMQCSALKRCSGDMAKADLRSSGRMLLRAILESARCRKHINTLVVQGLIITNRTINLGFCYMPLCSAPPNRFSTSCVWQ